MNPDVKIETERLVLRTVTMDDVDDVALAWDLDAGPISKEEAVKEVNWMFANHERNAPGKLAHLCLAIISKEAREFIGWCGLDNLDEKRANPVIFYLLKGRHRGQGLATEAAQAVLDHAFGRLALARIDGGAESENIASKRVMEKIGMRYLGPDDDGAHSFTLAREEWLRRKEKQG